MSGNNFLNITLMSSILFALPIYLILRSKIINEMYYTQRLLIQIFLNFLIFLLIIRFSIGALLTFNYIDKSEFWAIGYFYPIRIAYPNWGFLKGAPYLFIIIITTLNLKKIWFKIEKSKWNYFFIWLFAAIFLITFGGIHGGIVEGNIGISNSTEHIFDAQINSTIKDLFTTHSARITKIITPYYLAPHTLSHPAGSLAYWQIFTGYVSPFFFSILNALLFSLTFPFIFWALRRRFDDSISFQTTLVCLATPAMLIYGRSDDAVYYSLALIAASFTMVAVREKNYFFTFIGGIFISIAMHFSYAVIVLYAAVFSFDSEFRLTQLKNYIKNILPHNIIYIVLISTLLTITTYWSDYSWINAFTASVSHNEGSTMFELLRSGRYRIVINDRLMAISDFLIFAGPLMLLLLHRLYVKSAIKIQDWRVKDLALAVLLVILVFKTLGPGEVSRPWGSVLLLISFYWMTDLLIKENERVRWWIIKAQFWWAITLQTFLNFGW
jgi:hypothetical protein